MSYILFRFAKNAKLYKIPDLRIRDSSTLGTDLNEHLASHTIVNRGKCKQAQKFALKFMNMFANNETNGHEHWCSLRFGDVHLVFVNTNVHEYSFHVRFARFGEVHLVFANTNVHEHSFHVRFVSESTHSHGFLWISFGFWPKMDISPRKSPKKSTF